MSLVAANIETDQFAQYKIPNDYGGVSYAAGFPSYPANFSRDTLLAGILASHPELLASQLDMSAQSQGVSDDIFTGEQAGRVHHEMPGAKLNGRTGLTTYNAGDTTALFLIAAEGLSYINPASYREFLQKRRNNIQLAVQHILEQTRESDGLLWESPPKGADQYTLRVTYWKDSILPHENGKLEPVYPVSYGLAHFIGARGILSAARVLNDPELEDKADNMFRKGIETFLKPEGYAVYHDSTGELRQTSSDELHSLAFIPAQYSDLIQLSEIQKRAESLESPHGFMCTPSNVAETLSDDYHGAKVWVFEQALIHYGSTKFGLHDQATIARKIEPHIGEGQELFSIKQGKLVPEGNDRQLWSVAAASYFTGNEHLQNTNWL